MIFKNEANEFMSSLPYKKGEYGGRNWGHPWHSLCSYHGKLKPSIAHFLIKSFTNTGDIILDPLCGVGTIPFEACLQGRIGIGNDLSKMAYAVTMAKVKHPKRDDVDKVIEKLAKFVDENKNKFYTEPLPYYDFGFNGKIPEYFHPDTYAEILSAREFFKKDDLTSSEAMVLSAFLHVLHGNRPYALSRNSHPLTPYKPTGDYIYKNVVEHITNKIDIAYKKINLEEIEVGDAIYGDFKDISKKQIPKVDAVICSPPFVGSLRFYIQNWMRLWCVGWEPNDYAQADINFLEAKQKKSMDIYYDFFAMCNEVLKPHGKIILHLGNSKTCNMADELEIRSKEYFGTVYKGAENVEDIEKHGIKDKGGTFEHQFLFLQKK